MSVMSQCATIDRQFDEADDGTVGAHNVPLPDEGGAE